MTLETQAVTLAVMMACGLAMGIVFDGYRVLTWQLPFLRRLTPVLDLLYWAGVTLFVFRALNGSNEGQLRFFIFLGLAAGVLLYYLLFSRLTVWLVRKLIEGIRYTIRLIVKLFHILVVKPLLLLIRFLWVLLGIAASVSIFLLKVVLQLLYPFRILLRWLWKLTGGRIAWRKLGTWILHATRLYKLAKLKEPAKKIWRFLFRR
ncbi:spore cortex biosynthesis protein YabQ [Gorillibacterium timonense]|uniref:spore cortex biosynthesis protein YabQ n=1 Tax=Gorillibacterium timonense TaxID=1689269 RepID=UPI00071D7462|nr:spore cortex biosynthesis protein YabQ [Gorillibacterium timonense]